MTRVAFFISGTGGNAMNLLSACREGAVPAEPTLAISSSASAAGVERLRAAGLEVIVVERKAFVSDESYSNECFSHCERRGVDIVCLCGFLKKLFIPDRWMGRILNIHPGPLPQFGGAGMYGHFVHEAVLAAGVLTSGATVHLADNEYDHGEILAFRPVPVLKGDTPEALQKRVYEAEMSLYPAALREYIVNHSHKGNASCKS
jgi:formyltetrahydrofolate-dependent phosphoribosylglycinamide formyltransferase